MYNTNAKEYETSNHTKTIIPNGDPKEYQDAYRQFISVLSEIIAKYSGDYVESGKLVA